MYKRVWNERVFNFFLFFSAFFNFFQKKFKTKSTDTFFQTPLSLKTLVSNASPVYLYLLCFLSNSNRTEKEFQWAEHIRNMVLYDFRGLTTVSDFWGYVDKKLLPTLYMERHPTSNDKLKWKERLYVKDLASFRIGPARLRQVRRAPPKGVWRDYFPGKYEGDQVDATRPGLDLKH